MNETATQGHLDQELRVPIITEIDIVIARQRGRDLAARLGFSSGDLALIATAISEMARNIVQYAQRGEIVLSLVEGKPRGIIVIARDNGPGIPNLELAM